MNKLPEQLQTGSKSTRSILLTGLRGAIDQEKRTVELAFASETGVERYWGVEILDCSASSVRMDRLQSSGPLLMDHDTSDQVGVIESVQIGADRVIRAVVRFGRSARASEIFQDVVDGIRSNVSVGYLVHEARFESEKDGVSTYRITDWEPYEVSVVSVPADIAVGVGRAQPTIPEKTMPDPIVITQADVDRASQTAAQSAQEVERKRVKEINDISSTYKRYGLDDLAREAVNGGMSVDEFRQRAMDQMIKAPKPTADIGLTESEKRQYSMIRVINALANPQDRRAQEQASFELECHRAASELRIKNGGKPAEGIVVPFDVLTASGRGRRDLTKGTNNAGGYTVATDLLGGSFIELLRAAMVIDRLGTRMLTGLVGNIAIPKQSGGATAYWVGENTAPTESQQTFGQVTMNPKTVGTFTDISRKLLLQSSIDVEALVQEDLAKVLGLAIQSVAIKGGGSNEPTGILGTAGIGDVAGGTNGAAPTWPNIVALETAVSVANADVGTLNYLTNPAVRGKLKNTEQFSTTNGQPVWKEGNTPLNGYSAGVTNGVPSNLTKGSASGVCSAIIFGNFSDLLIGMWGGLDLLIDPYTGGAAGTVRVRVLQDVDVAVRHAESFAAMLDALTA